MRLSFVIATRNRSDFIIDCIRSIDVQEEPQIEVIVIDNSDDIKTEKALRSDLQSLRNTTLRYVHIPYSEQVLADARNLGVRLSAAPLVAFVDDDTVLDPQWISECCKIFQNEKVAGVSGTIREPDTDSLDPLANLPIGIIRDDGKMETNFYLTPTEPVKIQHLRGCNWACRKSVFEEIGGFDPSFRHIYEEADLSLRISQSGGILLFDRNLSLLHRCGPRAHLLRKRDSALHFRQKKSNLQFYTYLLLRRFGITSPIAWRHILKAETGLNYLIKDRSSDAIKEVFASVSGKTSGITYYLRQKLFPSKPNPLADRKCITIAEPVIQR